jgi:hypothetical protein
MQGFADHQDRLVSERTGLTSTIRERDFALLPDQFQKTRILDKTVDACSPSPKDFGGLDHFAGQLSPMHSRGNEDI